MSPLAHRYSLVSDSAPLVRQVEATRPLLWLRRGWDDWIHMRGPSSLYGLVAAIAGALLLGVGWQQVYLAPALAGGFLLVAPFLAIGLYALSRQREKGEAPDLARSLEAWRSHAGSIGLFGLMLTLTLILWERLSAIIFALFTAGQVPDLTHLVADGLGSGQYGPLVIAFVGTGALVAAAVFTYSVVTAPMLLDRPVDAVTAALTSLRCCLANPGAMVLWAALLAGITLLGFATMLLGMIVLFPWLAHATWHAYRDLVE